MQSVLRAGGLLHSFGGRRSGGAYADALNYEAMLALDEHNVRRGVRKCVLERLHAVRWPPTLPILARAPHSPLPQAPCCCAIADCPSSSSCMTARPVAWPQDVFA
jgi:hypothetical protein